MYIYDNINNTIHSISYNILYNNLSIKTKHLLYKNNVVNKLIN